jgi:hypothetical protein
MLAAIPDGLLPGNARIRDTRLTSPDPVDQPLAAANVARLLVVTALAE